MEKIWKSMIVCGVCLALVAIPFQTIKADDWSDCSSATGSAMKDCIIGVVGVTIGGAVVCYVSTAGMAAIVCAGLTTGALVAAAAGCMGVAIVEWDWCWAEKDFGYNNQKPVDKFVVTPTSFSHAS